MWAGGTQADRRALARSVVGVFLVEWSGQGRRELEYREVG
jgi:hypothetical protein